jgi:hypothetical protein
MENDRSKETSPQDKKLNKQIEVLQKEWQKRAESKQKTKNILFLTSFGIFLYLLNILLIDIGYLILDVPSGRLFPLIAGLIATILFSILIMGLLVLYYWEDDYRRFSD